MKPGAIGFARTRGIMGKLIRLGSWLRFRRDEWNHCFIVSDEVDSDGHPLVIQATLRGVTGTARLDSVAPGGQYVTMAMPSYIRLDDVVRFAKAQVGDPYGLGTILAIAVDVVTWNWFPSFRGSRKNSWVCSGLSCESLRFGGWFHNWTGIYTIFPQQAYDALMSDGWSVELSS